MDQIPIKIELPDFVNKALSPLADRIGATLSSIWDITFGWIENSKEKIQYKRALSLEQFKESLNDGISKIPPENLCEPKISIIGPTMEASKYYLEEKELRDMFSNLIVNSLDSSKRTMVHPAFVDIIKQLSPADAQFFRYLSDVSQIPICKVRHQYRLISLDTLSELNGDTDDADNSTPFTDLEYLGKDLASDLTIARIDDLSSQQISLSLSNLSRLGIISINYGSAMDESEYESFTRLPKVRALFRRYPSDNKAVTVLVMGTCELTSLGKQFASICL